MSEAAPDRQTADGAAVRDAWARFAQRRGGRFVETERRGVERLLPASVWRPVIRLPLGRWTLRLEATVEQRLPDWRLPGLWRRGDRPPRDRFGYSTLTAVRYRSADGFRFALSTSRSADTHLRQRRNVEYGMGRQLPAPLDAFRVHSPDPERALGLLRRGALMERLAELDREAPIDLAVAVVAGPLGLSGRRRHELRLRSPSFPADEAALAARADVVGELFDALRRAGAVDERATAEA